MIRHSRGFWLLANNRIVVITNFAETVVSVMSESREWRDRALTLLRLAGVALIEGTSDRLTLRLPDGSLRKARWSSERAQRGHTDDNAIDLVVTQGFRPTLYSRARAGAIDLVDIATGTVIVASHELAGTHIENVHVSRSQRKPWGRWAVMRSLLVSTGPLTQKDLATAAGISQGAVSMIVNNLPTRKDRDGWSALNRPGLLEQFLSEYPGPGGVSTYWLSLKSLAAQSEAAISLADELAVPVLIGGDIAADRIAPWRLPSLATMYTAEHLDYTVVMLTPVDPSEATLRAIVPDDPTVFATAGAFSDERTVDPVVLLWELRNANWSDAGEAADRIQSSIVAGWPHD